MMLMFPITDPYTAHDRQVGQYCRSNRQGVLPCGHSHLRTDESDILERDPMSASVPTAHTGNTSSAWCIAAVTVSWMACRL
ncbi:hypothetical protein EDD86DRAFT_277915 [Gorgonomyces haynaldii]|nr:hypothetical protein EDD86DRAFT_277915 [Gorgonomyces haynaldii]